MIKVLIAMPHGRKPDLVSVLTSLPMYMSARDDVEVTVSHLSNGNTPKLRNDHVNIALQGGYTHVLFVDNDMVYPDGTLDTLLEVDAGVVCGWYCRKVEGFASNAFARNSDGVLFPFVPTDTNPHKIVAAGTGCMLVKTDVLRHIGYPYFEYEPLEPGKEKTEDITFSAKVEKAGVTMVLQPKVICWHIGQFMVRPVIGKLEPEMTAVSTDIELQRERKKNGIQI